ncbi:hypothetical protein [Streptomyces californicus]|uniref:hypothetical protein n=1 Tax=Streptomyces californicus TaxID=67351 RepID=UPI0036804A8A
MPNKVNVWSGTAWVDKTPKAYTNGAWVTGTPMIWDGAAWMSAAPTPQEYPAYVTGNGTTNSGATSTTTTRSTAARMNDYIVSIIVCASGRPTLNSPTNAMPTYYTMTNGMVMGVALWPFNGTQGNVVWDTRNCGAVASMNLYYRYGDVSTTPLAPVISISEYTNTSSVPLPGSADFTSAYVAFTTSSVLTGFLWPDGVTPRATQLGTFGKNQISIITADTPGAGGSPGSLQLDTTVGTAAVALIQIPGKSDGKPTWILGDTTGSVLDQTTYLG